jgi:hypothetical protein
MPARSADDVRIETYSGPRANLRRLFELAEDSVAELDSYIDAGRVLVATAAADIGNLRFYQRQGFRMRSVERDAFTPATGYPPGLLIDGIELRDRVWLDRVVLADGRLAGHASHERRRERLQVQARAVAGPVAHRDHARRYQLQAAEETLDLVP